MARRISGTQRLTEPDRLFYNDLCIGPGSLFSPLDDRDPLTALRVGSSWGPNFPAQDSVGLIESYTLAGTRLTIGSFPIASGAIADTYEGTLDGRKVCVKRYRCYSRRDPRGVQEVRHSFPPFALCSHPGSEIRPGGYHVGKHATSEHCHSLWYYHYPPPICF